MSRNGIGLLARERYRRQVQKDLAVCRFVGHIMTMNSTSHLRLPDANDPEDIDRHQDAVLIRFSETFDLVDSALRDSIPKAKTYLRFWVVMQIAPCML